VPSVVARLRARKAELDRAKIRYEMLVMSPNPEVLQHAVEAARLAEVLGRPFEAAPSRPWSSHARRVTARPARDWTGPDQPALC